MHKLSHVLQWTASTLFVYCHFQQLLLFTLAGVRKAIEWLNTAHRCNTTRTTTHTKKDFHKIQRQENLKTETMFAMKLVYTLLSMSFTNQNVYNNEHKE